MKHGIKDDFNYIQVAKNKTALKYQAYMITKLKRKTKLCDSNNCRQVNKMVVESESLSSFINDNNNHYIAQILNYSLADIFNCGFDLSKKKYKDNQAIEKFDLKRKEVNLPKKHRRKRLKHMIKYAMQIKDRNITKGYDSILSYKVSTCDSKIQQYINDQIIRYSTLHNNTVVDIDLLRLEMANVTINAKAISYSDAECVILSVVTLSSTTVTSKWSQMNPQEEFTFMAIIKSNHTISLEVNSSTNFYNAHSKQQNNITTETKNFRQEESNTVAQSSTVTRHISCTDFRGIYVNFTNNNLMSSKSCLKTKLSKYEWMVSFWKTCILWKRYLEEAITVIDDITSIYSYSVIEMTHGFYKCTTTRRSGNVSLEGSEYNAVIMTQLFYVTHLFLEKETVLLYEQCLRRKTYFEHLMSETSQFSTGYRNIMFVVIKECTKYSRTVSGYGIKFDRLQSTTVVNVPLSFVHHYTMMLYEDECVFMMWECIIKWRTYKKDVIIRYESLPRQHSHSVSSDSVICIKHPIVGGTRCTDFDKRKCALVLDAVLPIEVSYIVELSKTKWESSMVWYTYPEDVLSECVTVQTRHVHTISIIINGYIKLIIMDKIHFYCSVFCQFQFQNYDNYFRFCYYKMNVPLRQSLVGTTTIPIYIFITDVNDPDELMTPRGGYIPMVYGDKKIHKFSDCYGDGACQKRYFSHSSSVTSVLG